MRVLGLNYQFLACQGGHKKRQVALDIHSRIKWARRQVGKTLFDISKHFGGDLERVFGALISKEIHDDSLNLPDSYMKLIDEIMGD